MWICVMKGSQATLPTQPSMVAGVKCPVYEDHPPPSVVEVNKEWKCSLLPLYTFMMYTGPTLYKQ